MSGVVNVVSVSGGKDSVALWLWALRTGLNPIAVYADTRWEWEEEEGSGRGGHYKHLELLEARIGKLHRVAGDETFEQVVRRKKSFPSRVRKWCAEELKLEPFRAWLDRYRAEHAVDVQLLVGLRREESAERADPDKTPEREWSDFYDCEVWRPILDWTVEQVIAEHRRAAVPMHPLYHHGAERVGCFPCVNASKAELAVVGRLAPKRIARIRALEQEMGATMFVRDRRAEKKREIAEWRRAHPAEAAAYDAARLRAALAPETVPAPWPSSPSVVPIGIDEVIAWANTERGGKQLQLVRPRTGCARWGVCEAPPPDLADDEEEAA